MRRPGSRFRLTHWTPRESDVLLGAKQLLAVHPEVALFMRNNVGKGHVLRPDFTQINPYQALRCQLDLCYSAGFLKRNQVTWIEWGQPSWSDLIGQLNGGRFFAAEVKKPGEKPTPEQQLFIEKVNESGGLGMCISDVQELATALNAANQSQSEEKYGTKD